MSPAVLPMFPLGTVLLPGMVLPLRVFEPRYRTMFEELGSADPALFGSVLIERGSEVGGGDVRTGVGCLAAVHDLQELPGGELAVVSVGTERIRIDRWLEDDPYPRAEVRRWPDEDEVPPTEVPEALRIAALEVAATAARLAGTRLPEDLELSADVARQTYELAILTPLGPLDRLRVLAAPTLGLRLALLEELVQDQRVLLDARDRFGGPDTGDG